MSAVLDHPLTLEAFLAWESTQSGRHEFHAGEVFAMVGARRTHGRVVSNLNAAFFNALRGGPCQVFAEGMKLQVADDTILYPDVFVTCDKADLATEQVFRAPSVVVEVLSPSTQAYDRSVKFAFYRRLASLREYVLVDPDTRRVESFRRGEGDVWTFHDMSDDAAVRIACLDIALPIADVFDGIEPPAGPAAAG